MADEEVVERTEAQKELDLMIESLDVGLDTKPEETKPEPEPEKEEVKDEPKPESKPETEVKEVKTEEVKVEKTEVKEPEVKRTEVKSEPKVEPEKPLTVEEQDFLGDLDLDDITRDPKEFNKFLNIFHRRTVEDTRKILGEGILKTIPDIVKSNLVIMKDLEKMSNDFYEENTDLKPFKKVVATVFEEIAAENPDKRYNEVIKEVGPEVRKRLDLHKKAVAEVKKKEEPPKLPKKGGTAGRSTDKPDTSPLQDELDAMTKSMGRS